MLKPLADEVQKFEVAEDAWKARAAMEKLYREKKEIVSRFTTLTWAPVFGATCVAVAQGFRFVNPLLLLILVGCCAYTIFAQVKIAIGEEWTVLFKIGAASRSETAATMIKLYKGRMVGLVLVNLAVFSGVIFCMNNTRTNFTTNDLAYDKEVKAFVAVGTVDWLPESRYTIVDVDELSCAGSIHHVRLDVDDDKRAEYFLRGRYNASVDLGEWKRFVAKEVNAGNGREVFNFCDYVHDELFLFGWPYTSASECDGEPTAEEISFRATAYFLGKGILLGISFDIERIEHELKN